LLRQVVYSVEVIFLSAPYASRGKHCGKRALGRPRRRW